MDIDNYKSAITLIQVFSAVFLYFFVLYVLGYFFEYNHGASTGEYSEFKDVHVMISIGFGYLMPFLCHGSFTATGHSLLLAVFSALWGIINVPFWHCVMGELKLEGLGIDSLVNADCCAGSILIAFGAMLGRLSLPQMLCMAFFQVIFYSMNKAILVTQFGVADMGGSMVIHTFGAYFGLACSLVLEKKAERKEQLDEEDNQPDATHVSDTMAMVGTLFLWCFWPSFNAYFAGPASAGGTASRAVVNTYLSLCGSTVGMFYATGFIEDKISMVNLQKATLAGGVAIGAASPMLIGADTALIVGSLAGAISVVGYTISPYLQNTIGLRDTCGIHNLHGMPGVIGAIVSIFMTSQGHLGSYWDEGTRPERIWVFFDSTKENWGSLVGYQVASLFFTLAIAIFSGALTGAIIRQLPSIAPFLIRMIVLLDSIFYARPPRGQQEQAEFPGEEREREAAANVS